VTRVGVATDVQPPRGPVPTQSDRPVGLRGSGVNGSRRSRPLRPTRPTLKVDFFFPDSQDQIDPSFDFERESSSPDRVRQRDDRYAHETISPAPYTGILLSKALVDGPGSKYTFAQRHRLYRLGVRRFFRLDECDGPPLATLGDCGAFNYVREEKPPYSVEEVVDFYDERPWQARVRSRPPLVASPWLGAGWRSSPPPAFAPRGCRTHPALQLHDRWSLACPCERRSAPVGAGKSRRCRSNACSCARR
jgi:hypothetical protein